ncbi:MAG: hypothetical protein ACI4QT_07420 [Kiritimatiellia bacterium]
MAMKILFTLFASLLMVGSSYGGVLTGAAKIAAKGAKHGADNVVEHAVTHYSDDAARVAAKGAGKAAVQAAPKVAKAVDKAVDVARIEANAAKPVVEAIHRTPIVKPTHVLAAGGGAAAVVGTHNLTAGERTKDQALADATRETLAEHPEMLPEIVQIDGETGIDSYVGRGVFYFMVIFAVLTGTALALRILHPIMKRRMNQKPNASEDASKPAA